MQDYSSLDTSRNATAVMPARGWRTVALRLKAFYLAPGLPRRARVKRIGWTAALVVSAVVLHHAFPSGPEVIDDPALPPPVVLPAPPPVPYRAPLPPDTAKMFTQQELDQKRDAWVDQTQAMAADSERRAPGSLGAYQARSLADFLAAHCGKPGGCLKKP